MKVTPKRLTAPDGRTISLTKGRAYEVLGIEADDYRLLTDEDNKPYGNDPVLYEPECFEIIDANEPDFWVCEYGEDGERYCYPPDWSEIGFFEDYHDEIIEAKEKFWNGVKKYYPETWKERSSSEPGVSH